MKHLAGADLYDYIALRRVAGGGIARVDDCWYDSGRAVPGYVADTLVELLTGGLVALAARDPAAMARASLTGTGTARYEQLCHQ